MDINKILRVSSYAGRIILENGGETYRVEETICRICAAYGFTEADGFVTPTGIMVSVTDKYGRTSSTVKRVKNRTVNLEKIAQVNELSRIVATDKLSIDEFYIKLREIESCERYSEKITVIFAAIAAGAFSIMFGGNIIDGICAFFVGLAVKVVCNIAAEFSINEFFINCLGGAISAALALIFVSLGFGENLDMIIIGAIMLLVPGLAITNAIRDTIAGDLVSGLTRAAESFLVAISIAIGTGTVLSFWFKYFGGI
ncbi:threonine/serine exporter family protein [Clostridium fallax]|uniref:Uncharacterized membrane protein YjjP, DUF1212 family n=1 Tax=Clostridium fallax TaxID=1533 RepID=A0A1M4ZGS9_9CLOT|nr:threonine/serine exporter family protein [Clostridium fallax]SHF17253.1 Uncharacterized membrane protein YjjP, DUF1212 family [Clostridium fallax]SQB06193.1 membrane spanning protein [Clostridium fallax]